MNTCRPWMSGKNITVTAAHPQTAGCYVCRLCRNATAPFNPALLCFSATATSHWWDSVPAKVPHIIASTIQKRK
jgi:hypothetical protein